MLRTIVPRTVVFGGVAAMIALGNVMALDPSAHSSGVTPIDPVSPLPSWTLADAAEYPGCQASSAWPAGRSAPYLVVHGFRDDLDRKVAFNAAWQANHDDTEVNDVWVVGVCG